MTELKIVKLKDIDPNPFRDGSGGTPPATWESVTEAYGFSEEKLRELQDSYRVNGVWAGIHARPVGSRFQLAFGHHRMEAAKRLGEKEVPLLVAPLSDDQMLQFMAAENSEEYGHDFALGVMNAVEAVVKAYGGGLVELEPLAPTAQGKRGAPSFRVDYASNRPYNAVSIGKYLGWVYPKGDSIQAAAKVIVAVNALELIELGALKRSQLKGLGNAEARELITLTQRAMRAEAEKHEKLSEAFEERKKKALAEGDKNVAKKMEAKLAEVEQATEKAVLHAAKGAASKVVEFHKESKSFAEAARKAAESLDLKKPVKAIASPREKLDLSAVDTFAAKLDSTLLEEDSRWEKVLELAETSRAKKTFNLLAESLDRLAERARARARELRKVLN